MLQKNRVLKKFEEMVKINSPSLQEKELANKIKNELNLMNIEFSEDNTAEKINGNCGNIIAEIDGDIAGPTLLIAAHMDRVEPGREIEPVISGDYIKSAGKTILAADDIIGVTAILEALNRAKKNNIQLPSLIIVFTVAEEIGMLGAKNLPADIIKKADYGIVLDVDGAVGKIVYKAPSRIKFNAVIRGKTAHAGTDPERGVNAIKITSHAISTIDLGHIDKNLTANIGVIKGGIASNMVPDMVELEGEVRSFEDKKIRKQIEHMKNTINFYVKKFGGKVEYNISRTYSRFNLCKENKIIKISSKAAKKLSIKPILATSRGGSDANILNSKGLPTINLGTGMKNVHSTSEKVKIESLYKLIDYVMEIFKYAGWYS
ncbi:MAG: M20/M25/M40 family metallo-hydrolase [Halanaerobiales bacterium]